MTFDQYNEAWSIAHRLFELCKEPEICVTVANLFWDADIYAAVFQVTATKLATSSRRPPNE